MNATIKRIIRAAHTALRDTEPPFSERLKYATKWLDLIDLVDDLSSDPITGALVVATREHGITDDDRAQRIVRLYVHAHANASAPVFDRGAWGSFHWS